MSQSSGIVYFVNPSDGVAQVVFDPWCSRDQALCQHSHLHTEWAENIYDNHEQGTLATPAIFPEWGGQTVVLIGRGESAKACVDSLQKTSLQRVFLNHSYLDWNVGKQDWVMAIDPRFRAVKSDRRKIKKLGLITMPGFPADMVNYRWREVRGVSFWNKAPLDDWMRRMFPHLPEIIECTSVSVSALHLMAVNKVKRVICVGWDFCGESGEVKANDINGDEVRSTFHHFKTSQAATFFARLVGQHSDMEIINASGRGLFGLNISANPSERVEEVKQVTPDELPKLLKE